jgi:outer membrane protein OmpA-like peptidoglycan-associated protein
MSKAQQGAIIGAAGGAVAGGLIGNANGSTAKGAIIGAVVGGAAGGIIGNQMDRQARELEQDIPGATVERVGEGILVTFPSGLLFDFDSDVIRGQTRTNLNNLASSLNRNSRTDVTIVGHTDAIGTDAYNQDLSERRAASAAHYLMSRGVRGARLTTRGLGESEPVASNETEGGRERNRRVEVAIYANEAWRDEARRRAGE